MGALIIPVALAGADGAGGITLGIGMKGCGGAADGGIGVAGRCAPCATFGTCGEYNGPLGATPRSGMPARPPIWKIRVNSPGAAGGGGGGGRGATGAGVGAGCSTGGGAGGLTLAGGAAGRAGAGGGGGGANGGGGGAGTAGWGAEFAGFPVIELKSRVNSPACLAGGAGGGGGTTGGAGGGAGGALAVGAMGAMGCVIDPVALAAAGGGGGGGGGGEATFPAPPLPARIGCVDPGRGWGSSDRRIVTLICLAAPALAPADPPGVCDDIHTSNDSKPCRNCVTTTGCPSTSNVSISLRRSISGNARTRASTALFSSVVPTR